MALKRLQEIGLIIQVHRRRSNGSKRSSLFILVGWTDRKLVEQIEDHPALQQLYVEGVEDMDTIIPHVVREADQAKTNADAPVDNSKPSRTRCGTLPHDMRDPPARGAGLEPSIEPSKETNPLTPLDRSAVLAHAESIKSGKRFLCTNISAFKARECIGLGLVSEEEVRAVGIAI